MSVMSYETAVEYLGELATFGMNPSLDTIRELMRVLGNPQNNIASIQVTGTNGKTSVTRLTAAILHAHGKCTGCFTSPHLHEYTERIEVNGEPVHRVRFAREVDEIGHTAVNEDIPVTEFELLTATALFIFAHYYVDFGVFEVGMGGRWDSTSVVSPVVSVITGVSLDHTEHLGDSRRVIAIDKAHIIKSGSTAILGPGTAGVDDIFQLHAQIVGAPVRAVRMSGAPSPVAQADTVRFDVLAPANSPGGTTRLSVHGVLGDYENLTIEAPAYQAANVATAIAAAEAAVGDSLEVAAISSALENVRFPARFEVFPGDPLFVVDGSHNPEAAAVLAGAIRQEFGHVRPRVVLGILADKDARGIVEALAPVASAFEVTAPQSPRALPADDLADIVEQVTGVRPDTYDDVRSAINEITVAGGGPFVVTGSLTTAAEARSLLGPLPLR